ncbi:MAG: hypothetical protein V2J55_22650, partial [Candidatus Competibacteraceae bacterium]|nr:hypothetical protein [Candidatus Competibacteraceae bacterium]
MKTFFRNRRALSVLLLGCGLSFTAHQSHADVDVANLPLFLGGSGIPLSLLVMGRDHKLFYEAYNDASDLNQDGEIDVGYIPDLTQYGQPLDYYGYFDSYKCYDYQGDIFVPVADTDTNGDEQTKKCVSAGNYWSGDFLNYLTTARIDAIRRILYGGYRATDANDETILERARVPQDAHSWGKEYKSIDHDGYDIQEYSPLNLPELGTRHLFANTTPLCPSNYNDTNCSANPNMPLLRVLDDSIYRVWEWVAIEQPVAGRQCAVGNNNRRNCANSGGNLTAHPSSHQEFTAQLDQFAIPDQQFGTGPAVTYAGGKIDCDSNCNPFGTDNNYFTVFKGILNVAGGSYEISVDGDDAIEVIIDGNVVVGWYGGHGKCGDSTDCRDQHKASINLSPGAHDIEFRHEEVSGGDNYYLYWKGPDSSNDWEIVPSSSFSGLSDLTITTYGKAIPESEMTDYVVRVQACVESDSFRLEPECQGYPADNPDVYKPVGILHDFGEDESMAFGLLSGSYKKSLSGGILRKNMSSFANEVDQTDGTFILDSSEGSIVDTINNFQVVGFGANSSSNPSYSYRDGGCGIPMLTPMQEGRCAMWGNPVAEMMYEGLRYFAGKSPADAFSNFSSKPEYSGNDLTLNMPAPTWKDPYRNAENWSNPADADDPGYSWCSKPFEVVIADANSFDTDQLPGSYFSSTNSNPPTLGSMSVAALGGEIWDGENESSPAFI